MKVAFVFAIILTLSPATVSAQQTCTLRPDDLFQLRRVGPTAWSPDGQYLTIDFPSPLAGWKESRKTICSCSM